MEPGLIGARHKGGTASMNPRLVPPPAAPKSIADTGMSINFLLSLMLKTVYMNGLETALEMREELKLSGGIVPALIREAVDRDLFESLGRTGDSTLADNRYALTAKGREWAVEALVQSQYVGPAPVTLREFHTQIEKQQMVNERIGYERLTEALDGLVIPEGFVSLLGPAVNSGRSILFYGPPGNGKTTIADRIGGVFEQAIYVPYCLVVDGHIINVYDSTVHTAVEERRKDKGGGDSPRARIKQKAAVDERWLRCKRPVVTTGGELTLEMLDLNFNPYSKVYEAPMQMKATGGVFILDDFGRQMVSPGEVLNRWIIPLERRVDYLTLHTGKKFPVPFDELVVFSTNLDPKELMDAATMRRIQYKMEIDGPTKDDYVRIFRDMCEEYRLDLTEGIIAFLMDEFYPAEHIPIARYHPRWIVEQVVRRCEYEGSAPKLERKLVVDALRNLYTAY